MKTYTINKVSNTKFRSFKRRHSERIGIPLVYTENKFGITYEVFPIPQKGICVVYPDKYFNPNNCYWYYERDANLMEWWRKYEKFLVGAMFHKRKDLKNKRFYIFQLGQSPYSHSDGCMTLDEETDRIARLVVPSYQQVIYKPKLLCPERF